MLPRGYTGCGPTPENGREGPSRDPRICSCLNAAWLMTLRSAPPSINTWCSRMLATTRAVMSGSTPAPAMLSGAVGCPGGDGGASPPLVWGSFGDPWDRRKNLPPQGLDAGEDVLKVPLGRLVVEVSSLHSRGFFVSPLPARPTARRPWRTARAAR
jgi:hypothetical protein